MKKVINEQARTVTFTFDGLDAVIFDANKASTPNKEYAMLHGFAARIGDKAALQKNAENGFAVTETMRREMVSTMADYYHDETQMAWELRVAAGPRKPAINPTWAKMAELSGRTYETIAAEMAERDIAELMRMTNMVAPRG